MPSVINEDQTGVPDGGRADMTPEQISRSVDLIIIRLRAAGYKFDEIAEILNRPAGTLRRRMHDIPERVREHYASVSLG